MESKASPAESNSQEGEECAQEEGDEVKRGLGPVTRKSLATEQSTPPSSEAVTHSARPEVDLLGILRQGWDLRSVWAPGCSSASARQRKPRKEIRQFNNAIRLLENFGRLKKRGGGSIGSNLATWLFIK